MIDGSPHLMLYGQDLGPLEDYPLPSSLRFHIAAVSNGQYRGHAEMPLPQGSGSIRTVILTEESEPILVLKLLTYIIGEIEGRKELEKARARGEQA